MLSRGLVRLFWPKPSCTDATWQCSMPRLAPPCWHTLARTRAEQPRAALASEPAESGCTLSGSHVRRVVARHLGHVLLAPCGGCTSQARASIAWHMTQVARPKSRQPKSLADREAARGADPPPLRRPPIRRDSDVSSRDHSLSWREGVEGGYRCAAGPRAGARDRGALPGPLLRSPRRSGSPLKDTRSPITAPAQLHRV
jgi:hypothetical protein